MRCFVITKKHIAALLAAAAVIPTFVAVIRKGNNTDTVSVFKESEPDHIVSSILPTTKETSVISEIKDHVYSAINKTPNEVVASFGGIFSETKHEEPSPSPAQPTAAPETTQAPTEEKTAPSDDTIKNDTDYEIFPEIFKDEPLAISKDAQVLIIHTHTTESYAPEEPTNLPDTSRSTDETKNMIAIGEVVKAELEKSGITVVHDKTVHDYPSYQGAYGRSLTTAKKHTEQNGKICVVLDIHRDAIVKSDGTKVKLTKDINGVKCAQLMLVCGTDGGGLSHPSWRSNLNFAFKIREKAEELYPGLMRPINLREERFNQHLTKGSLILEVGTHGNTITEAKNGAVLIAKVISEIIKGGVA